MGVLPGFLVTQMAPSASTRVGTSLCLAMRTYDRTPHCADSRCKIHRSMSSDSLMTMRERESLALDIVETAAAQGTSM